MLTGSCLCPLLNILAYWSCSIGYAPVGVLTVGGMLLFRSAAISARTEANFHEGSLWINALLFSYQTWCHSAIWCRSSDFARGKVSPYKRCARSHTNSFNGGKYSRSRLVNSAASILSQLSALLHRRSSHRGIPRVAASTWNVNIVDCRLCPLRHSFTARWTGPVQVERDCPSYQRL